MMPRPVVFDFDGTLTSERYNESNLLRLKPQQAITSLARTYKGEMPVIVSTARPDRIREETEEWLREHDIDVDKVYMRYPNEESLPDARVKERHLAEIREEYGDPVLWFDDNREVLSMLKRQDVLVMPIASP